MRLTLVRAAPEVHHLVWWTFHHLLVDGWSVPLVLKEVFTVYAELCQGRVPQIAPTRPYRDFIDPAALAKHRSAPLRLGQGQEVCVRGGARHALRRSPFQRG